MTDSGTAETCKYVFDPAAWDDPVQLETEELDDDGVWRCPHQTDGESAYCLFHRAPDETDPAAVADALQSRVAESGSAPKQFVGATLGPLDLSSTVLRSPDNHPIDFRHAELSGPVTLEDAIVGQPLCLDGAIVHDRLNCNQATFEAELYCSSVTFRDQSWFNEVTFEQGGWFHATEFTAVDCSMARFRGKADFREASLARTNFYAASFEASAEFHQATFEHASFTGVDFGGLTYFDGAELPERATFRHSTFATLVSFEDVACAGSHCYVELAEAVIRGGRLHQPSDGVVLYDLRDATVGDVRLGSVAADSDLLSRYRFIGTEFDGFDFGRYRDSLTASNWTLHAFDEPGDAVIDVDEDPAPGTLEHTYLRAKNGANDVGDTDAAAEFFRKQMVYRRRQYGVQLFDGESRFPIRPWPAAKWTGNFLLDFTSGYGERPSRTVAVSVGVVGVFAMLFGVVRGPLAYGHPVGPLVLSLESFVGLVLGGAEVVRNPWVRLIAAVEGFAGAFLIALFVFALTRSIHR